MTPGPAAAGLVRRCLESLDVRPQRIVRAQPEALVAQAQVARSGGFRFQGPAGDVKGLVKVVGGGPGLEVGPEEVQDLLAVQSVSGARASSLTRLAALRRRHPSSPMVSEPTRTSNRPSNHTRTSPGAASCDRAGPKSRRSAVVRRTSVIVQILPSPPHHKQGRLRHAARTGAPRLSRSSLQEEQGQKPEVGDRGERQDEPEGPVPPRSYLKRVQARQAREHGNRARKGG